MGWCHGPRSGLFHEYMWLALHAARPGSSKYVFGKAWAVGYVSKMAM